MYGITVAKDSSGRHLSNKDHFFLDELKDPYSTELLPMDRADFGMKFDVIQCHGTSFLVGGEMMAYSGNGIGSS